MILTLLDQDWNDKQPGKQYCYSNISGEFVDYLKCRSKWHVICVQILLKSTLIFILGWVNKEIATLKRWTGINFRDLEKLYIMYCGFYVLCSNPSLFALLSRNLSVWFGLTQVSGPEVSPSRFHSAENIRMLFGDNLCNTSHQSRETCKFPWHLA